MVQKTVKVPEMSCGHVRRCPNRYPCDECTSYHSVQHEYINMTPPFFECSARG